MFINIIAVILVQTCSLCERKCRCTVFQGKV